jgi:hypothetical protein
VEEKAVLASRSCVSHVDRRIGDYDRAYVVLLPDEKGHYLGLSGVSTPQPPRRPRMNNVLRFYI